MKRAELEQLDAEARVAKAQSELEDERLRAIASETPVAGLAVIRAQQVVDQAERRLSECRLSENQLFEIRAVDLLPEEIKETRS